MSQSKASLLRTVSANTLAMHRESGGNVAMMFALSLVPLLMVGGMALDMKRATDNKSFVQDALDASVLAASRTYIDAVNEAPAVRESLSTASGLANFHQNTATLNGGLNALIPTYSYEADYTIVATTSVTTPTVFSSIVGVNEIISNVSATAKAGDVRGFEIVLVLDNTSSMFENNRMTQMREAAKLFTNLMYESSPEPELTRISVIPWAAVVNINSQAPNDWVQAVDDNYGVSPAVPASGSRKSPDIPFENRIQYLRTPDDSASIGSAAVADLFKPVEWRGCIKGANNERSVSSGGVVTAALTPMSRVPSMRKLREKS